MLPVVPESAVNVIVYWLGVVCTLSIFTILYGENRLYRLFEHFFIGLAVGYGLFITIRDVLDPVWWRAMATESSGTVFAFDKSPQMTGVTLDTVEKREGEGAWRWSPRQTPRLRLTKIAGEWGAPNYLKLWLRLSQPVPDGHVTLRLHITNPDARKPATMTATIPTDFAGWREITLQLRRDFQVQGNPYRRFEKVGRHRVVGIVTAVDFIADEPLQRSGATVHLDALRHCIGYRWWWAGALIWGLMFYTVLSPHLGWMSRMALSVLMGLQAGYTFKAFVLELGPQIADSFRPLVPSAKLTMAAAINNAIFVLVLLCVMTYFFFSIEHRHPAIRAPATLGRWLLMLTFGIVFGNTVMGRFSLFIGRLDFLILQSQIPFTVPVRALIIALLAVAMFALAIWTVQREQRKQGGT